jgi:erythromycin esterase
MPLAPRALLAACIVLAACDSPSDSRPVPETPLEWVEQNAHTVRSISISDRDYGDLRGLRSAVGDARVVMLGEQTHNDGATFLAKARLVAFLHREMGFDVLVWESGLYDVDRVWQRVLAGQDVTASSRQAVFGVWSLTREVEQVFDYVESTLGSSRPLEMAGMDSQISSLPETGDSLGVHVDRFAREIGSPVVNDPQWATAVALLRAVGNANAWYTKPNAAEQASLLRLMETLRAHAAAAGGRRALFWAQTLASVEVHARMVWSESIDGPLTRASFIAREDQMARNTVWLANEHYRGRKIIVWGASIHLAGDVTKLRSLGNVQQGGDGWEPMGQQVARALGADDVYRIGFTAARGSWGRTTQPFPLPPVMPGSLEAHLDQLGMAYAFVDLRDPGPGGEWLQDALARPFGYGYMRGDWPQVFDGMFYTREMTPVTRVTGAASAAGG